MPEVSTTEHVLGHETKLRKYHDSNIAQTAAGCILSISLRKSMNLRGLYALWLLWWGFYQISLAVCSYFTVALRHAVRPEEQLPNAVHLQLTEHWLDTSNIKTTSIAWNLLVLLSVFQILLHRLINSVLQTGRWTHHPWACSASVDPAQKKDKRA